MANTPKTIVDVVGAVKDYVDSKADTTLSTTSTNPVQNKAIGGNLIDNGKTFKFGYRTSDSKYGYYDSGSTFHPFRDPTGDAAVGNVLSGKTFSNASSDGLTGTMTNRGAVSQTLNPGGSYTIPEGYHNGSGVVAASAVTPEIIKFPGDYYGLMHISATASSSNIVDTYSFFGSNNAKYFFIELFVLRDSGGYTDDWNYATNMIDSVTWTNITVLSQAHANTSDVYICKIPDISSTSRIRVVTKTISSPYKGFLVMSGYYLSV